MTTAERLRRVGAAGWVLALCACVDDGYLESVETIGAVCTLDARLAVVVTVFDPNDPFDDTSTPVDSVTATRSNEQPCYLERASSDPAAIDAGDVASALYGCWEQGAGTYLVRVRRGDRSWTQSVEVPADDCHVTELQRLTFELR